MISHLFALSRPNKQHNPTSPLTAKHESIKEDGDVVEDKITSSIYMREFKVN